MIARNMAHVAFVVMALGCFGCSGQVDSERLGSSSEQLLSGGWANVNPTTALTARYGAASCALNDHTILVAGGYTNTSGSVTNAVQTLDINAGTPTWTTKASLNTGRANARMFALGSNRCLIVGGINNSGTVLNSIEVYDGSANTWYTQTATITARVNFTLSKYGSHKLLVAGGENGLGVLYTTELLDTQLVGDPFSATSSWISRAAGPSLKTARTGHAAVNITDSRILIAGGSTDGVSPTSSTEAINAADTTPAFWWDTSMSTARSNFTLNVLSASGSTPYRAVAIGGWDGSQVLCSSATFAVSSSWDPFVLGTWTNSSSSTDCRMDHKTLPTGTTDSFVVIGGKDNNNYATTTTSLNSSEEYVLGSGFGNRQTFTDGRTDFSAEYLSGSSGSAKIVLTGGLKTQTPSVLSSTFKY